MPTALPTTTNLGEVGVCLLRIARLDTDCSPLGGNGSGYVTAGIADFTATPDVEEGVVIQPKNGCGVTVYKINRPDRILGYNISGNLWFFDHEAMYQMFGGSTILGKASGSFNNKVIGWAAPNYNSAATNGVYLEVITQRVAEGAGDCITSGTGFPTYEGHVFGKVLMTPGEFSPSDDAIQMSFTGKALSNPNLADGPWNDYPGAGYIPNSPYATFGYTTAEYTTILALAAAGAKDLPAGS